MQWSRELFRSKSMNPVDGFLKCTNGHFWDVDKTTAMNLDPSMERFWDIVYYPNGLCCETPGKRPILWRVATDDFMKYHRVGLRRTNPGAVVGLCSLGLSKP